MTSDSRQSPAGIPAASDALTAKLLRQGKIHAALDRAKRIHKEQATPQTEALLLACYAARIQEMRAAKQAREAEELAAWVGKNFANGQAALADPLPQLSLALTTKTRSINPTTPSADPLDAPLRRLADAAIPAEEKAAAEAAVARLAWNPLALASHPALVPEHPLAMAARAVAGAFAAVVAGPVADAEIALPEVSRRSPLAGWKLLIRAIAHLQRREDEAARQALAGLAALDSAPANLAPALLAVVERRWSDLPAAAAKALSNWRPSDPQLLPAALKRIDSLCASSAGADYERRYEFRYTPVKQGRKANRALLAALSEAAALLRRAAPDLLPRFRERAAASALLYTSLTLPEVEKALGGPARRSATFWRLLASAVEQKNHMACGGQSYAQLCRYWDAFRRHGAAEGWFAPGGAEEAELYRHMARQAAEYPPEEWQRIGHEPDEIPWSYFYDSGQSAAILAVGATFTAQPLSHEPMDLYARAMRQAPTSEGFHAWLALAEQLDASASGRLSDGKYSGDRVEQALDYWTLLLPRDPTPWIMRMDAAEKRNALVLAQKHLSRAEAADPLNADIAKARRRLALAVCRRHLKQGKRHLVAADLKKMRESRLLADGDWPWLSAALDWLTEGEIPAAAAIRHDELVKLTGGGAAGESAAYTLKAALIAHAQFKLHPARWEAKFEPPAAAAETSLIAAAVLRAIRILWEGGFSFAWGAKSAWPKWFVARAAQLSPVDLPLLARVMLASKRSEEVFRLSAAGLRDGGLTAVAGWLLLARATALRDGGIYQWLRIRQCQRAAAELGRRQRDQELLARAAHLSRRDSPYRAMEVTGERLVPMDDAELDETLRIERENPAFPKRNAPDPHVASANGANSRGYFYDGADDWDEEEEEMDDADCDCPDCRRKRGELPPLKGDFQEMFKAMGGGRKSKFDGAVAELLRDAGLSLAGAKLLAPVLMPALMLSLLTESGIGSNVAEFIDLNPGLKQQVREILPKLSAADRALVEKRHG